MRKVGKVLPLTENVSFHALLQRENRVQIPVEVRWKYKLEPSEILRVKFLPLDRNLPFASAGEFHARLHKNGRITIPWELVARLNLKPGILLAVTLVKGRS
ncbi:MAG: AbrB/MazE/SpoVT family DNA-binding domain-containing protein [Candidatus Bathyarchaeales archaeon]